MSLITQKVPYRTIGYTVGLATHVCNSIAMFLAMRGDIMKDPDIIFLKSNQFKYITIWNTIFQMLFLTMSLICDVSSITKMKNQRMISFLRSYSQIFFAGVVWPCSALIFLIFWPMYIYDRELLFPAYIDKALSQVSNHVMHTSILPIAIWGLIFQPGSNPKHQFWCKAHLVTVFVTYISFLLYNYSSTGTWPYPIFNYIYGTLYFPLFLAILLFLYVYVYSLQWKITALINDTCPKLKSM